MRNTDIILVGKPEVKRELGRPGCAWEDAIETDLKSLMKLDPF
jgi:hypothetical protein